MIEGISGTSIDINTIVSSLVARASLPLDTYESRQLEQQTELTALELIQGRLTSLSSTVSSLKYQGISSPFSVKTATPSNSDVLSASASSSAASGVYNVTVTTLAQRHKIATGQWDSASTDIADSEGAGTKTFRLSLNGVDTDIDVDITAGDSNETVLQNMAAAINNAGAGTSAVVVHETESSSRLVITSDDTGTANSISVQDIAGSLLLNSDMIDGVGALTNELVAAGDAVFSIDTLNFTRSSNNIDDAISGVTLSLLDSGDSTLTVGADASSIMATIESFVNDYNNVISGIKTQTSFDTEELTSAALTGDTLMSKIRSDLRSLATNVVSTQPEEYNSLFMIGIEVDKEGTMSITDAGKLEAAISADPDSVAELFNTPATGIASRMDTYLDSLLDPQGRMTVRIENVNKNIESIQEDIEDFESYLADLEATLLIQWSRVESLISSNDSLSLFMSQLLPSYQNS